MSRAVGGDSTVEERLAVLIAESFERVRQDRLVFSVLTVLLTPALIGVAVVVFLVGMPIGGSSAQPMLLGSARAVTVPILALAAMFLAAAHALAFGSLRKVGDGRALAGAVAPFALMLVLAVFAGWPGDVAPWLWPPLVVLGLATLALLGFAYSPRDEYYIGWRFGPVLVDNPFTLRDDLDRTHLEMGWLVAIPRLLFGAWGDLLTSGWLLRAPGPEQFALAARLLRALEAPGWERFRETDALGGVAHAGRAMRMLDGLALLEPRRDGPHLTAAARDMIELAHGLRDQPAFAT